MQRQVEELIAKGLVHESKSPCAVGLLAPKKINLLERWHLWLVCIRYTLELIFPCVITYSISTYSNISSIHTSFIGHIFGYF